MTSEQSRVAVVGAGVFGRNHLRVLRQAETAALAGVYDLDAGRAAAAGQEFGCPAFSSLEELCGVAQAAVVATPTTTHAEVTLRLLEAGLDVLVEKPIAAGVDEARRMVEQAGQRGRILQVGHLERFNPAVAAAEKLVRMPLFFEIHRLSVFSPRSLDVDVVADLMIHDLEIVLGLTGEVPSEVRAAGISVLSGKVDIANVRLAFPGGCVANLTASRVSTERVRKLRLFQPGQYISIDYARQEVLGIEVDAGRNIRFLPLSVAKQEPLKVQLGAFLESIRSREEPKVSGRQGLAALELAARIMEAITEHGALVAQTLARARASQ